MIAERNYFRARKGNILLFVAHFFVARCNLTWRLSSNVFLLLSNGNFPQKMCCPQYRPVFAEVTSPRGIPPLNRRSPVTRRWWSPSDRAPSHPINRPYPQGDRARICAIIGRRRPIIAPIIRISWVWHLNLYYPRV